MGTSGNVFERPPAREGPPSALFVNSKNLASSSPELDLRTAEFVNTCTSLPKWRWSVESYLWNLFSQLYDGLSENSDFGMHLGRFPGSTELQSWRVNFKNDVCTRTADPQLAVHWIQEVEIAKSMDELVTSRSIVGRTDFPDIDMIDAMIASALKRLLNTQIHFRKRASVEEQRAQKHDRFSREREIAYVIYEHFRAAGAYEAVQGLTQTSN